MRTGVDIQTSNYDWGNVCKNGDIRLTLWNSADIYSEDGTTLLAVIAQGQDITERKQAEDTVKATNQQLRASEQQLKAANQQLRASEQQLRATNQQLRASGQQLKAANQQLRASEQQLGAANQQLQADITERKRAEQELMRYQRQLKLLASELMTTEERERHHLATELHSSVGQSLAILKLKLDTLCASGAAEGLAGTLKEISASLDRMIQAIRTLTFDLSSPILYELGFERAVAEWLDEEIGQKQGIECEFEDDGRPKPLDKDISAVLFRDVRELLINVVKHAHASKVRVHIGRVGEQIEVSVEDNGVGFDPAKMSSMHGAEAGFGLFSIRERLEQAGGRLVIKSAPGKGCRVSITVPLQERASRKAE